MPLTDFKLKRKNIEIYFCLFLLLCAVIPLVIELNNDMYLLCLLTSIILGFLTFLSSKYTLSINDTHINLNNMQNIDYKEIKHAFVGSFSFIESYESTYNLPLSPFKNEALHFFFKPKKGKEYPTNSFVALHVGNQMYFIKGSFFNKKSFNKLIHVLQEKNVQLTIEA